MKKQLITFMGLKLLNFIPEDSKTLDNNGTYFQDFILNKNDSVLRINYVFDVNRKFLSGSVCFNYQTLKGREITIKDITNLIELM